ncbi:MAG: Ig-like domain-containing protein, partial [Phycisphaerales bacterium]|nr:Ig-like domain-containing protein [Phycisphaerales bacterium]
GNSPGDTPAVVWNPPQPGAYFISAATTDGFGNSATSLPVRVFVKGAKVFSPIAHTAMPFGSSFVINADAEVGTTALNPFTNQTVFTPGFVRQIEFFVTDASGVKQSAGIAATAPYSVRYKPLGLGFYSITATATDNNGATVTSPDLVDIQVVTPIGTPPTSRIVNPVDSGSVGAGTTVNIIADAGWARDDPNPGIISKVEFYLNGVLINTDLTFPFTATWTPPVPGRYALIALAFDDKGNVVSSDPSAVFVVGGLPTVAITSPAAGTNVVQGTKLPINVAASGSDGGISSLKTIELLVDGQVTDSLPKAPPGGGLVDVVPVLAEPFTFSWRSSVSLGAHKLAARVTDANGLTITSADLSVNVIPNQPPQIAITAPSNASSLAANVGSTVTVAVSDADGTVDIVEFFVDSVSVGTATKSPFQLTWTPTSAGTFNITAKATDNGGA